MKKQNETDEQFDDNFLKQCGRIFAYDLLQYSENGGDMKDITVNKVYRFLDELGKG